MTYIFGDSFDFYPDGANIGASLLSGGWSGVSNPANLDISSSVTRFANGKSLNTGNAGGGAAYGIYSFPSSSTNTIWVTFAHYFEASFNQGRVGAFFQLNLEGAAQIFVGFLDTGTIQVRRGGSNGTIVASFPFAFSNFIWNHWQIKIVIGNGTTGEIRIRKDGDVTDTYFATNIDTQDAALDTADSIWVGNWGGFHNSYIDDIMVFDSSGTEVNDWVGDIRAYTLLPEANGDINEFDPLTGSNFEMVDDQVPDGDTTYNYSSTPGATDLFNIQDLTADPATIFAVTVNVVAKKSDAGIRKGTCVMKSGGVTDEGATTVLPSSYDSIQKTYTVDPATGNLWTKIGVNGIQAGYKVIS
jgi:hypothetical protein